MFLSCTAKGCQHTCIHLMRAPSDSINKTLPLPTAPRTDPRTLRYLTANSGPLKKSWVAVVEGKENSSARKNQLWLDRINFILAFYNSQIWIAFHHSDKGRVRMPVPDMRGSVPCSTSSINTTGLKKKYIYIKKKGRKEGERKEKKKKKEGIIGKQSGTSNLPSSFAQHLESDKDQHLKTIIEAY